MNNSKISKKGKYFWGDPFWKTIHCICASYKPENAVYIINFFNAFKELIPCDVCVVHFKENLKRFPLERYLKNNHDLFFWSYLIHDSVNQYHNTHRKPNEAQKTSPSYDEIKEFYFKSLVSSECETCKTY
jgi:hypothetical protein